MSHSPKRLRYTQQTLVCPECQRVFTHPRDLRNHKRLHRTTSNESNEETSGLDNFDELDINAYQGNGKVAH